MFVVYQSLFAGNGYLPLLETRLIRVCRLKNKSMCFKQLESLYLQYIKNGLKCKKGSLVVMTPQRIIT